MNKSELIDSMADKGGITKADAERALNAFTDTVTEALAGDKEKITLVGFGTFSTSERAARTGRNPQTGETINIPATTVPKFKAGKNLKESVKG
ncbi:MAG: DNA-binding protein HU [Candidatus Marinimicrobia bacterium]|nr:DNA-binding protein HU [Candidatus Neomarinimicrobiota bacterium]